MGRMWWEDLNWERRRYRAWQAYGQSKLANQLFIRGLARRVPYDATLAHPGWSRTDLQRHSLGAGLGNLMLRPFNMSAERGALTTVRRCDGGGGRTCGLLRRQGSHPTRRPSEAPQARSASEAG